MWTTGGVGQSGSSPCALGAADYDDAIVLFFLKCSTFCHRREGEIGS